MDKYGCQLVSLYGEEQQDSDEKSFCFQELIDFTTSFCCSASARKSALVTKVKLELSTMARIKELEQQKIPITLIAKQLEIENHRPINHDRKISGYVIGQFLKKQGKLLENVITPNGEKKTGWQRFELSHLCYGGKNYTLIKDITQAYSDYCEKHNLQDDDFLTSKKISRILSELPRKRIHAGTCLVGIKINTQKIDT